MKLLVVDDESYTREGIVSSIPWEEYGIDEIMQADNGASALKMAKWFLPNIVITDIRMPQKDGIEFGSDLIRMCPGCRIIFMSGYMQIEYLKSAIELSAVAFVEKPISIPKIIEAVQKAISDINEKAEHQVLQKESINLKKQRLVNLLSCKEKQMKMVQKMCEEVLFPYSGNFIYDCLILQNRSDYKNMEEFREEIYQYFSVYKVECLCGESEKNSHIVVLAYPTKEAKKMDIHCKRLIAIKEDYIMAKGFPVTSIENIYNSYQMAESAFNYTFYDKGQRLFEVDDRIMMQKAIEPGVFNDFTNMYTNMPFQLVDWFDNFIDRIALYKCYRKDQVILLVKSFIKVIIDDNTDVFDYMEEHKSEQEIDEYLDDVHNIFQIQRLLQDISKALSNCLEQKNKYSRIISSIMEYIAKNFWNPSLSVQEVADYVRMSPTYASILFKKEMNINLKQYISNVRLSKAKELLLHEYYTIDEIAEKCGYSNANYFAKVFRESMDMTPSNYRKKGEQK